MSSVTLTAPPGFFDRKWEDVFVGALFAGADELGQIEQFNVMSRTPVLTGALMSDVSYQVGSQSSGLIVFIYSGEENQIETWNRVYDIYQEGGALGAGSNNGSGDHQMYGRILTDDLDAIVQWGESWLQKAADAIASGGSV